MHVNHTDHVAGMMQRIREMHAEDMDRIAGAMHSMARTQDGEVRSRAVVR